MDASDAVPEVIERRRIMDRERKRKYRELKRSKETPEQAELRKLKRRKERELKRTKETPEQAELRKFNERERKRQYREQHRLTQIHCWNPMVEYPPTKIKNEPTVEIIEDQSALDEIELRRLRQRESKRLKRMKETQEEAEQRKQRAREQKRRARELQRATETPDEAYIRKFKQREMKRQYREQQKLWKSNPMIPEMVETVVETYSDDNEDQKQVFQNLIKEEELPADSDPLVKIDEPLGPFDDPLMIPECAISFQPFLS